MEIQLNLSLFTNVDHFKRDEFLGRITDIIYFFPFTKNQLRQLVIIELKYWAKRASTINNMKITWTERVVDVMCKGYNIHFGARSLRYEVEKKIIERIAFTCDPEREKNSLCHIDVTFGEDPSSLEDPIITISFNENNEIN
ncbi:hypothetical protein HZS_4649 [Henneguya salminicola]|nr:hypothetical protein HZS_4649 [Henneguya salminicola]